MSYVNPSSALLKELSFLSKLELVVLSRNYEKFIDNIKKKDKLKEMNCKIISGTSNN